MNVDAYLDRIGYTGPTDPNAPTLAALHLRHALSVPFENLDIHLKRPIVLDYERLFDKIVTRHRGGFCYELNGMFTWLLRELGFKVTMHNARVHEGDGKYGIEFDHMTLRVELDEPWLADVGYGEFIREPLRWVEGLEQREEFGTYRLMREGDVWRAENQHPNGKWWTDYIFTLRPHQLADFAEACVYQQTSPDSTFTQKRVATLATPDGRVTLSDTRLIVTRGDQRDEQPIKDEAEYRTLLKQHLGIDLDAT